MYDVPLRPSHEFTIMQNQKLFVAYGLLDGTQTCFCPRSSDSPWRLGSLVTTIVFTSSPASHQVR